MNSFTGEIKTSISSFSSFISYLYDINRKNTIVKMIMRAICFDKIGGNNYLLYTIPFNDRPIFNVPGISEVPSVARNLDGAIAKSDMHLLGDPKGKHLKGV